MCSAWGSKCPSYDVFGHFGDMLGHSVMLTSHVTMFPSGFTLMLDHLAALTQDTLHACTHLVLVATDVVCFSRKSTSQGSLEFGIHHP